MEKPALDVFEAIRGRRSVRAFTKKPVSDEEITKLIDAANWAPSAGNIQPWEFIIVRDANVKSKLSTAALNQTLIKEAPVAIVVCADQMQSSRGYGSRGANLYCLQDTAAATQNILLAAHAMGLAACWIGAFLEEEVRKVLNIPSGIRPVAIVPVGYPGEKPMERARKPLNEIIHYETFEQE
jgi:nitroreductase